MRQWTHEELHQLIGSNPDLKAKSDKIHKLPQSSQEEREQGKLQMMEIYAEATGCKQVETAKAFVTKAFLCMKQGLDIEVVSAEYSSQKKCHAPLGNNFVCFCDEKVLDIIMDELYQGREGDLKEKLQSLSYKDFLGIALDFLECKYRIESVFPQVRGFMFAECRLRFVIDEPIDDATKKEIREACVDFVELGQVVKGIKDESQQ